MDKALNILIVKESEADANLLVGKLRRIGYTISSERVETTRSMAAALDRRRFDIVFADYSLRQFDALQAMDLLKDRGIDPPLIIVSPVITEQMVAAGMRRGARDYLTMDGLTRLAPAVKRELDTAKQRRELRQVTHQLRVARQTQRCLLPGEDAAVPGFDVAGAVFPDTETTRDYYDFVPMSNGCLGIAVGDVMGHGMWCAILMAEIRAWLRTLTVSQDDVGEILTHVNALLVNGAPEGAFVTLLLARLDPTSRTLTHASAGHRGYVIDREGDVRGYLESTGLPLGVEPDSQIPSLRQTRLEPDDIVLFATHGFCEALSPEGTLFGTEGIQNAVRRHHQGTAREMVKNLYADVRSFVSGEGQHDDMAIVVLKALAEETMMNSVA